ncbi:hypothetical protein H0X32_01450 [Patescibacteria group bacterium]|nr:hypothetical protein [Patescibacteria group bacterium]
MKYFIDFDRTIFDTNSFKKTLERRPTVVELVAQFKNVWKEFWSLSESHLQRRLFRASLGAFLSNGRFLFVPADLKEFLYPDALAFFERYGEDCTIVTYGIRAFITAKVTSALTDISIHDVVYTGRRKGRTIQRLCAEEKDQCTFIDDAHFQLASVTRRCPNITVIEMRRDSQPGDGRWPVIHSFDELVNSSYEKSHC